MDNNEYLDFDEAVQFLKTTPSTLYKWLQAGKLPGHKLGRQWRFLKDELEIHVSGKGTRIQIQKDFLHLSELLLSRSKNTKNKENKMEMNMTSVSEKLIWDAFDHGSQLIHIYPTQGKYEISYRTDAGMQKLSSIQEDFFKELDESLALQSTALDQDESSRRLSLQRADGDVLHVKYQRLATVIGDRLTLRLRQSNNYVLPLEKISSDQQVIAQFKKWVTKKSGLFLVSGVPGSGKTTTVYSLINEFKNQGQVVFAIESGVDFILEGIGQVEIKGNSQNQFDEIFEKVYQSDPDVICLGLGSYLPGIEEKVFKRAYEAVSAGHIVIIQIEQPTCKAALENFQKFVKFPIDHLSIDVSCQKIIEEKGKGKALYEFLHRAP